MQTSAGTERHKYLHCFPSFMTNIATFTKRVGKSRLNYVVWIPKDVSTLLRLKSGTIVEVKIRKLRGDEAS